MPSIDNQDARTAPRENVRLERRYGSIGISAVAAAVRYHDGGRSRALATATPIPAHRFEESAV